MHKKWRARKPSYFFLVFGRHNAKHSIEGGIYPHRKGHIEGSGVSSGDVLLLYQNLGTPGIGVVIDTDTGGTVEEIDYQFFPLDHPPAWVSLDTLRSAIPELHVPLNFVGNWLQQISDSSFQRALADAQIKW